MYTRKTKLQKHTEKIRMRGAERRDVRARLLSYMEYHPLHTPVVATRAKETTEARQLGVTLTALGGQVFNYRLRIVSGFFALLLLVGVPVAAEQAVPGDTLYPVKVRFNEEVRSQLSLTPYQKVAWETRVVERRIAEARLLASEGKLTDEVEAEIAENVREHTKAAREELAEMHASDADEAAVAQVVFESALDVQSAVLDASEEEEEVRNITNAVKEVREEVATEQEEVTITSSYENFTARVGAETALARELLATIEENISNEEEAKILKRIEVEEQAIAGAADLHEAGEVRAAMRKLRQVLLNIQKIMVFMTDVDVRAAVAFESLVPNDLTPEEHKALLEESLAAVRTIEASVIERAPEVTDEETIEEVAVGMEALGTLIRAIETALAEEDLGAAEKLVTNALVLAHDLDLLTEELDAPEEEADDAQETETETETEGEDGEDSVVEDAASTGTE